MTFPGRETSKALGSPITLYRFSVFNDVYAYTDAEQPVTFDSVVYKPIPISRDSVTASGSLDKSEVKIGVPHDSEVAELFRVFPPSEVVGVAIFQGHNEDPDDEFLAVYYGRVMSCRIEHSQASLSCEPISTSMRRPGLRRRYQYGCPHALYGSQCGVSRAAHTYDAVVTAHSGASVTLAPDWWVPSGQVSTKFVQGLFEWQDNGRTELRTILQNTIGSRVVLLDGIASGLLIGATVKVSLGCNHKMLDGGDCGPIFNNVNNFGGQPWIPLDNPVRMVNKFY